MSPSSISAVGIGAFYLVVGLLLIFRRDDVKKALDRFPRDRLCGQVITLICIGWFAWQTSLTPMGEFSRLKMVLYGAAPVAFFLIITYLDEMLAVRSLGAFFLLLGVPILRSVFLHDSNWRILLSLFVYIMVVKGMFLVAGPFHFRRWVNWCWATPGRVSLVTYGSLVFGIMAIAVGFTSLR